MKTSIATALLLSLALPGGALAQTPSLIFRAPPESVTVPTGRQPSKPGMAPGLVATELSPNVRYFRLVFARGDDVMQGLAEFAEKNNLANSRFTAIGAFESATIALTDASKEPTRVFKATRLNEDMEISAFNGSITRNANGQTNVHAHTVVTLVRNGQVYAGHFIEGKISLTMQLYLEDSPPLAPPAAAAAAAR
jgi:predicted DNA-binding protein with PD1-like motif